MDTNVNISFAGCGFLGIYHIGVASCIKEYAPHLLLNKISGASIGALAGACLLADVPLGVFTSDMLQLIYEIRQRTLGPFNPLVHVQNMLRGMIYSRMPKNAFKKVSGRLYVSLTKVADGSNVIMSEFQSEEELVNVKLAPSRRLKDTALTKLRLVWVDRIGAAALLASAFVPFFSGFVPPKIGQFRYMDGGFSNNLPILNENTITVSPFCGESDICPRDSTIQLFHINLCNTSVEVSTPNIYRFARILFPPSPEVLSKMCRQGFDDALKFLQRNNLISCTKCLTVLHTITMPVVRRHSDGRCEAYDPECGECMDHIERAATSKLPDAVLTNLENAIEVRNKELASWIHSLRNSSIVSLMTLPYILTFDAIWAFWKKVAEITPVLLESTRQYNRRMLEMFIRTLLKLNKTGLFLVSKVFGPISISIRVAEPERNLALESRTKSRSKINLELNFDPEKPEKMDNTAYEGCSETLIVHPLEPTGVLDDTYDHLLNVIHHHDSVMAFYYLDEKTKQFPQMNMVEFIDVTNDDKIVGKIDESDIKILASKVDKSDDADSEAHSSSRNNIAASYSEMDLSDPDDGAMSICSGSDGGNDMSYIPSDPESDWGQPKKMNFVETSKPESERKLAY